MRKNPFILIIHEPSSDVEPIRQALPESEGFRLQCVTRLSAAIARIAGGGVEGILVDLSCSEAVEGERLDSFLKLKSAAAHVPIVVLSDSEDDVLLGLTTRVGASASLTKQQCKTDLKVLLRRLIERGDVQIERPRLAEHRKSGPILTVLGSKGGVGASTVALNVACYLAQSRRVILAELRPALGTLAQYLRPHEGVRDLSLLLQSQAAAIKTQDVEACLWPYKSMPGLRVLFGPQALSPEATLDASHATTITRSLSGLADQVVIDLPATLSEFNRAVIEVSDCLGVVVERDPICVEAARRMLKVITSWEGAPPSIGAIVLSRTNLIAPLAITEMETRLGIPIFAVIPPAADDCIAAQRANRPLVLFDNDGLAGNSLAALATLLSETAEPLRLDRSPATVP